MTTTPFTFDLTITLPDGGRLAKQLVNLYFDDMAADINRAALALCEANAAVKAQKFADLRVKRADGWSTPDGSLKVYALFSVSGEDSAFVEQVIAGYMDGFSDSLQKASGRYFPHSEALPQASTKPADWKVEVHPIEPPAK